MEDVMDNLKPCPFCGEIPKLSKHYKEERWQMIHRCKVMGPIVIDWNYEDKIIEQWNTRYTDNENKH